MIEKFEHSKKMTKKKQIENNMSDDKVTTGLQTKYTALKVH